MKALYKIQRITSKLYVTAETLQEARSIAREDAKKNNTTLVIKEKRGNRFYKIETVSR